MLEIYRELQHRLAQGEAVVLATVVQVKGSAPRAPGAKMLVCTGGSIVGTVGGGYPEHEATRAAGEVMRAGRPRLLHVEMTADVASRQGGICGGTMDIFLERIVPQ